MSSILCVDVGTYSIKSLLLEVSLKRYQMLEFHESILPEEIRDIQKNVHERTHYIKEHINKHVSDQTAVKIYSSISGDHTVTKLINFPFKDKVKIKHALRFELENHVPFSMDDWIVSHCVQPTSSKEASVIASMVEKNELQKLVSEFSALDNEPEHLNTDALILANLDDLQIYKEDSYAQINIGHVKTNIIVVENGIVTLVRSVPIGGYHLTTRIASVCNLNFKASEEKKHREARVFNEEELEKVDKKNRNYYRAIYDFSNDLIRLLKQSIYSLKIQDRGMIQKIYLSGGTAKIRGLDKYLAQELKVPISDCLLGTLDGNKTGIDFDKNLMPTVFAIGLKDLVRIQSSSINFRVGEFIYRRYDEKKTRIIKKISTYVGITACCLLVLFFARCSSLKGQEEELYKTLSTELQESFTAVHKKIFKNRTTLSRSRMKKLELIMKEKESQIHRNLQLIKEIEKSGESILDVLRAMSISIGSDIKFDIYNFEYGNKKVLLEANAKNLNIISQIVKALERNHVFNNVKQSDTKAASTGSGQDFKLRFEIQ